MFSALPQNISLRWSWVSGFCCCSYKHSAPPELGTLWLRLKAALCLCGKFGWAKMKRKRRTEITIETHQSLVLRSSRRLVGTQCAECAGHSWLVSPEDAAALAGVNLRTIFHWVEASRIHFAETPAGLVLICPNSLSVEAAAEARPSGRALLPEHEPEPGGTSPP